MAKTYENINSFSLVVKILVTNKVLIDEVQTRLYTDYISLLI